MSILHPSPGRREIKNPFIGLSPPSPLSIATLFWIWTRELLFYSLGGLGGFLFVCFFFFLSFLLCVRRIWSDIWHEHEVLDAFVNFQQMGWENIAVLGKVLYNNGMIFLFQENLFPPMYAFFSFLPSFLITCCRWLILHSCRLCCKSVSSSKLKIIA